MASSVLAVSSQALNTSSSNPIMSPSAPPTAASSSKRSSAANFVRGRQTSAPAESTSAVAGGGTSSRGGGFKEFFRGMTSGTVGTSNGKGKEREKESSSSHTSRSRFGTLMDGGGSRASLSTSREERKRTKSTVVTSSSSSQPPPPSRPPAPPPIGTIRQRTVSVQPGSTSAPNRPARPSTTNHTPYLVPSLSRGSLSSPALHLSSNPLSEAHAERSFLLSNSIDALISPPRNRSTTKSPPSFMDDPTATIRPASAASSSSRPPPAPPPSGSRATSPPPPLLQTPKRLSSLQNQGSIATLTSAFTSSSRRRQTSAPTSSASSDPPPPPPPPLPPVTFQSTPHPRSPSSASASSSSGWTTTHKRTISYPISESRQAIRQASSFVLREMARPLPPAVKSLPSMGWEEVEMSLRGLARSERSWAGMGMGTVGNQGSLGEERERKAFASAFRDGVVLCFILNRLFSVTLQPPLRPSLKESEAHYDRNVTTFITTLSILGLPPRNHFYVSDLLSEPANMEGLQRVANTILEVSRLPTDLPSASTFVSTIARRRNSSSSVASSSTSSILAPSSYSPPSSPKRSFFAPPPDSPSTGRSGSPTIPVGQGLATAEEERPSDGTAKKRLSEDYRRRITPPSPLRQGSQSEEQEARQIRRSSPAPSPSPSPAGTPRKRPSSSRSVPPSPGVVKDRRSIRTSDADAGSNPRFSLLSDATDSTTRMEMVHDRERTPSLVSGGETSTKRESTDSRSSFNLQTPEDGLQLGGLIPVVEIVGETPIPSPSSGDFEFPPSVAKPRPTRLNIHNSSLGTQPTTPTPPPNLGPRVLPSILRPSSPSGQPQRPLGVRRVSPSQLARSSTPSGDTNESTSPAPAPQRRHVPKRGASIDLSRKSSSSASAVSLPGLAENGSSPPDGMPSRNGSPLLAPVLLAPSRPSSPGGSNGGQRVVPTVHRRNTTQGRGVKREMSPPPLRVPFPVVDFSSSSSNGNGNGNGSHSVPASPFTTSPSRPASPSFAAADGAAPDYSRPPSSRTTKFADEVDEGPRSRSRESSAGGRPVLKKRGGSMSEEGRFGKGGSSASAGGGVFGSPTSPVGGLLSRDGSTTSLMKGSETRQLITFREEGKPSVVYRLGNCIGKGQFGTVYRALNLGNGSMHAIKRIRLEGLQEDDITQLMKEVELLKRLSHPSIVKYEGMMRDEDTLNIILEYIENGSLGSTLKSFGDLTEHLVSSYVMKILEGLHYLHTQRVVHCDLKAANILTTKSGNVKLSDFGVSLNLVAVEHKKENDVAGTPNWMAPEVIQMEGASTASDIWSLGCTVIELLTGKPPFAEIHNGMAVMYRIVEGGPPPFPENASPELKSFLSQCFEKDPTMRPSADVLFEHDWVKPHLAMNKLRPQDSIPFLRRVSADMENLKDKEALSRASLPPPERPFERSYSVPTPVASPTRSPTVSGLPSPVKIPSRASESTLVGGRQSQETARRPAILHHSITMPIPVPASKDQDLEYDRPLQEHRFVKSTFSKAVICKICADPVRKSAVFCEGCTLLCHVACAKIAPINCDLRAQMLASTAQREHLQRKSSSIDSNLPLHSPLSSSPTNGTNKLFGNWKRSKSPTHNGTPSNDFTVRRRSEDRPLSPSNSRWAFPSIPGRQNDDRPRSRQSRLSMTGSSSHSNSNEGSYGSTSSAARRASHVQESRDSLEVSEFALSSASGSDLPLSRIGAERMSMDTARSTRLSVDDGTRGHKGQGSRDCSIQ